MEKTKRPSFQFYPESWTSDKALRVCSLAARGLWMEMMCLMHDGEPYGYLTINGNPCTPAKLARAIGEGVEIVTELLAELEENGVFKRDESGAIYSKRMLRDEQVRVARGLHGAKSVNNPNVPRKKTETGKPAPEPKAADPEPEVAPNQLALFEKKEDNLWEVADLIGQVKKREIWLQGIAKNYNLPNLDNTLQEWATKNTISNFNDEKHITNSFASFLKKEHERVLDKAQRGITPNADTKTMPKKGERVMPNSTKNKPNHNPLHN